MLLALVLIVLVILAVAGGLTLSPLLWLILLAALIVAAVGYGGPHYRSRL